MPRGIVREFDPERGTGVIEEDDGREIRVHRSGLEGGTRQGLHPGDIVEFQVGRSRKGGTTAVQVVRIGWEEEEESDEPREWTF